MLPAGARATAAHSAQGQQRAHAKHHKCRLDEQRYGAYPVAHVFVHERANLAVLLRLRPGNP